LDAPSRIVFDSSKDTTLQIAKIQFDTVVEASIDIPWSTDLETVTLGVTDPKEAAELISNYVSNMRANPLSRLTVNENFVVADAAMNDKTLLAETPLGGIDFNAGLMNLDVQRDGSGIPLPIGQQPFNALEINGFIPVIINVQRSGPSTGMPTKTEQADLLQTMYGRNGESPLCILAAKTPSDCFYMAIEAVRIAIQYMTPVVVLSDSNLANGSEPWKLPAIDELQADWKRGSDEPPCKTALLGSCALSEYSEGTAAARAGPATKPSWRYSRCGSGARPRPWQRSGARRVGSCHCSVSGSRLGIGPSRIRVHRR